MQSNNPNSLKNIVFAALMLGASACTASGEVDDTSRVEDMGGVSVDMRGGVDLGARDMRVEVTRDMTPVAQDMGHATPLDMSPARDMNIARDMGEEDMSARDMGVDMEPEVWPEHSGTACDVDGTAGVCLPTSRCPGTTVAGKCPGPSNMQCCLSVCDPGQGDPGQCTPQSSCNDWAPANDCVGPAGSTGCCRIDASKGTSIGTLWNTYYYLSNEADHSGAANTALNDANCNPIATVSASFSDSVCIEGSGKLADGRVINYAQTCQCGRPCPTGGIICYSVLDASQFPWGKGARSNPLVPFRSLAVDRGYISLGTVVYLEQWDGFNVPAVGNVGGFVHDGCFRADDVGGAIQGDHIDIFSGTRQAWQAMEASFPTNTRFDAYTNTPKCAYLKQ